MLPSVSKKQCQLVLESLFEMLRIDVDDMMIRYQLNRSELVDFVDEFSQNKVKELRSSQAAERLKHRGQQPHPPRVGTREADFSTGHPYTTSTLRNGKRLRDDADAGEQQAKRLMLAPPVAAQPAPSSSFAVKKRPGHSTPVQSTSSGSVTLPVSPIAGQANRYHCLHSYYINLTWEQYTWERLTRHLDHQ